MPRKREWRILRSFDWAPKNNLVMAFRAGEIRSGLTQACIEAAGDSIEEIGGNEPPAREPLGKANDQTGA